MQNNKLWRKFRNCISKKKFGTNEALINSSFEIFKAGLADAWTDFNIDDPSTHPTKKHYWYLVELPMGDDHDLDPTQRNVAMMCWSKHDYANRANWEDVIRYLDVTDIMP